MTPSDYKARYERLPVTLQAGALPTFVTVNKYRLRSSNYNATAASDFAKMLAKKKGADREVIVNTPKGQVSTSQSLTDARKRLNLGRVSIESADRSYVREEAADITDWQELTHYVFLGKGSPEGCQVVLQLAQRWGLVKTTLQDYADDAMGLDCNGFVGNYIWHERKGKPWYDAGVGNLDVGPDLHINDYFTGKAFVQKWSDIDPNLTYILGMVDSSGNIMKGGPGNDAGHFTITQAGRQEPRTMADGKQTFAIRVVESTAGALPPGLSESWYSPRNLNGPVFSINRESMAAGSQIVSFKLATIDPKPAA